MQQKGSPHDAHRYGDRSFGLHLNDAVISISGQRDGNTIAAALQSPPTRSAPLDASLRDALLDLFGYAYGDLDPKLPPAKIHGGSDHALLALRSREALARMAYEFERGRVLMVNHYSD